MDFGHFAFGTVGPDVGPGTPSHDLPKGGMNSGIGARGSLLSTTSTMRATQVLLKRSAWKGKIEATFSIPNIHDLPH